MLYPFGRGVNCNQVQLNVCGRMRFVTGSGVLDFWVLESVEAKIHWCIDWVLVFRNCLPCVLRESSGTTY